MARPAGQADQPDQRERARGYERHVLAGDGEQVVEARGPESLPQVWRERLFVAEHDALDHTAALAVEPRCDRPGEQRSQLVGDAAEAAPVADELPAVCSEHDVDALVPEPGALVEAVCFRPRQANGRDRLEHGALRRRASERELQESGFAKAETSEARHLGRDPKLEPAPTCGRGDDEVGALGGVDARE